MTSVEKTRKTIMVEENYTRCSVTGDIPDLVAEVAFDYLDALPRRVTAQHTSIPYSLPHERRWLPCKERVVTAARSVFE